MLVFTIVDAKILLSNSVDCLLYIENESNVATQIKKKKKLNEYN